MTCDNCESYKIRWSDGYVCPCNLKKRKLDEHSDYHYSKKIKPDTQNTHKKN